MTSLKFVPYKNNIHKEQFFQLNLEYLTWANDIMHEEYEIRLVPEGTEKEYLESVFPKFTAIKPPEGIIYILETDGKAVGMGALKKLEDKIGEIKRMYIRSEYRGGLGRKLYYLLEDKAREFGFEMLRLDTSMLAVAAVNLYRKVGFKEIERYTGGEWGEDHELNSIAMFMEKRL
jgi:ribosomal protein S18 acetylase RimI-like enzyme